MKKKIAIFGGAFNPITIGHLKSVESILQMTDIPEVWVLPCYKHTHNKFMQSYFDRFNMCITAFLNNDRVVISDFEFKYISDNGSTYEMIKKMHSVYPNYEFVIVIGLDNANHIQSFYNYKALLKDETFLVMPRKGYSKIKNAWYDSSPHIFLESVDIPESSSTDFRNFMESSDYDNAIKLLPNKMVFDYIRERKLYET